MQIHLLQLPDWQLRVEEYADLDRWMYLFKAGAELDVEHPPDIMQTEEMRHAMQVLQRFSENERAYLLYQQRLEAERVEMSWQNAIRRLTQDLEQATRQAEQAARQAEQATQQAEQATQQAEQATQQAEQEREEKKRLLALIKKSGIDPTQL